MALIKSVSGIRGTIGGSVSENLTPPDIVKFTAAYGTWLKGRHESVRVVVGRDARPSGEMLNRLVCATLQALAIDVIDLGLSTTPTVEIAVPRENAQGGIILTASHNPVQWNALKLLNEAGEFISAEDGQAVLQLAAQEQFDFAPVTRLGKIEYRDDYFRKHIEAILDLPLVDAHAVRNRNFRIVVDAVNSSGGIAVPMLLEELGVSVTKLHCEPTGHFPHNPEPLPEHLNDLMQAVVKNGAHLGIAVDPDVDRLALVCEDGTLFGEEYTLVACADHVLAHRPGDTVSNLSSTRALDDVAIRHGRKRHTSAVGEVNVVAQMKAVGAAIGGEGNGGVILAELHHGRDALVGIALFLTRLVHHGGSCSELRRTYPDYFISKNKIDLREGMDVQALVDAVGRRHRDHPQSTIDGLRIELGHTWVHLRRSNTEPIVRVYAEAPTKAEADALAGRFLNELRELADAPADQR